MVKVAAALIQQDNGRFLLCRRPENKARALLWEFVGGKVEPGETPRQALIRECVEELGITVEPLDVFCEVTHAYPDLTVHLTVFRARITEGVPVLLEHCDMRWVTPEEAEGMELCPADRSIIEKLIANEQ